MKAYADFVDYWHPATDYDKKTEFHSGLSYRITERPNPKKQEISIGLASIAEERGYAQIRMITPERPPQERQNDPVVLPFIRREPIPTVKPAYVAGGTLYGVVMGILFGVFIAHLSQITMAFDAAWDGVSSPSAKIAMIEGAPDYRQSTTDNAERDFSKLEGK